MNYCIQKSLPLTPAAIFILSAAVTTQAAEYAPNCAATVERTTGLSLTPTRKSLDDLSITVFPDQKKNISFLGINLLEGACVDEIYASKMGQVTFNDGEVFARNSDGTWIYSRNEKEPTSSAGLDSLHYPSISEASFIMASSVDRNGMNGEPATLSVGIWKTVDSYIVAAFIKRHNVYTSPMEIARSAKPLKSVTFFPSPDSNGGSLWLLQNSKKEVSIISLGWDHSALSEILRSEQ